MRSAFAGTSSCRMVIKDNRNGLCMDPKLDPVIQYIADKGFFKMITNGPDGGLSHEYGVNADDIINYNNEFTRTSGWNAYPPINPNAFKGDLARVYTAGGYNMNFIGANNIIRKMMNQGNAAESFIIANIDKGTVEDVLTQIDITDQRLLHILFGEEEISQWASGEQYALKVLDWAAQIKEARPGQKFRFGWDIPTIYNGGKKVQAWIDGIWKIYGPVADKNNWFIRQYLHLFQQVILTGNADTDNPLIDDFIKNGLPLFAKAIDDSVFNGHRVILTQVSANENAYTEDVINGMQYLVACYFRFTKFMIESLASGGTRFAGQIYIGMNRWVSPGVVPNLDFQFVSIQNMLADNGANYCTCTPIHPDVDTMITFQDNVYRIGMQNNGSSNVDLPLTVTTDVKTADFIPIKTIAISCHEASSTTTSPYDPMVARQLAPYSINYFEVVL